MKKFFFILSFLMFSKVAFCQNKPFLAVAFYNLENFYDTINDPNKDDDEFTPNGLNSYTGKVFMKKVENLSTVISLLGTDKAEDGFAMMGCAEVENEDVLKALVSSPKLKDRHLKFVIFEGPDLRSIDCGLIYNPKYFKVLEAKSLNVPLPDTSHHTRDVCYVIGKLNGEIVHVFVNHWPSRRGGEAATKPLREIAASVSRKVIDSLVAIDPLTKIIVMGDLNDSPTDPSCAKVIGAKGKIEDVKAGGMFNPWISYYKRGIGTMAYGDTWGLFDQIMISYGFLNNPASKIQYKEAEVFNRSFMTEKSGQYKGYPKRSYANGLWNDGYSDHYPTILFLSK